MQAILLVLLLFIGVFVIVSSDLNDSNIPKEKQTSSSHKTAAYSIKTPYKKPTSFDIGYINGDDLIYIDRRVFRESLKQHLAKENKFRIKYNPFMEINFWIN